MADTYKNFSRGLAKTFFRNLVLNFLFQGLRLTYSHVNKNMKAGPGLVSKHLLIYNNFVTFHELIIVYSPLQVLLFKRQFFLANKYNHMANSII